LRCGTLGLGTGPGGEGQASSSHQQLVGETRTRREEDEDTVTDRASARIQRSLIAYRHSINVAIDLVIWDAAIVFAVLLRYDFAFGHVVRWGTLRILPFVLVTQVVLGAREGLYVGRWSLGSFEEVAALTRSVVITGFVATLVDVPYHWIPISAPAIASTIALVSMAGVRYLWRLSLERQRHPATTASRMIVFGAGEGAAQVITALLRNPDSKFVPVAIVDDDASKQHLRIRNVPVRGRRENLREVAAAAHADTMLIAIPSADAALVRELSEVGVGAGLEVRVLPPVGELLDGRVGEQDIRRLTEADLLGRREIDTDVQAIAGYLAGRRVLVTGAGGSIGSELSRQLAKIKPESLVLLDRDESALHAVQLSIEGRALLDSRELVVADLRDRPRMEEVFAEHRPEVVFHAAALKHLPLLQLHPEEGVKTNVWATRHLLEVSLAHGVTRFVNVSTDKAADPTSVLGYTKRITERLSAAANRRGPGAYLSVRFGNVLGSRGSVLTTFRAQIEAGGPVTVTHPDASRYFMTIEEAVQLVIQAGAIGEGGEVLVLDMGERVRIADLARRLIEQHEPPVEIVYTGLRSGEKVDEVLIGRTEVSESTSHELISRVAVPPLDLDGLGGIDATMGEAALVLELRNLCEEQDSPTYRWSTADD
jgi:FlaA1/EpsC-like NDP-sugar epimerase